MAIRKLAATLQCWGTLVVNPTVGGSNQAFINIGPNNSLDLQSTNNRWVAVVANFNDSNIDNRVIFQVRPKGPSGSNDYGGGNGRSVFEIQRDGDVRARGSFIGNQGYMDLAEYLPVLEKENLESGDIVVFDETTGRLRHSFKDYDNLAAGVISTKPAFVMGEDDESLDWGEKDLGNSPAANLLERINQEEKKTKKALLTLSGRVPAKVDATKEAVKIGDLLVTSDTPGYAMKGEPDRIKEGMLIGRALQSLEKGQKGVILILVK